jgi:hypothetical protein
MGDNANVDWEWKNTVVGEGYQAKGVIRQPGVASEKMRIVNMSLPPPEESNVRKRSDKRARSESDDEDDRVGHKKSKKKDKKDEKKAKKDRKHDKKKDKKKEHKRSSSYHRDKYNGSRSRGKEADGVGFNPLLQHLASSLSNKTRCFTLENE